jgi:ATP-dependent RNA helicase UAP56/SUB2
MSSHDNEELIDYEDEHDVIPNGAAPAAVNGATAAAVDGEVDKDKKNFSGIHSTGFRYVLTSCFRKLCSPNSILLFTGTSC